MTPERWRQVEVLFESVCAQPPDERSRFLAVAAGDDSELRNEVASLIASSSRHDALLEQPAFGGVNRILERDPNDDDATRLVGARLGAYRVTRVIASGGMGTVLLAHRDDAQFEKKVAIKVIRRGLGGVDAHRKRDAVRRFQVERQVLANLDHPHIARLIDGGTTAGGRPYYVMEYIEGQPIDRFCSEQALAPRDILSLFSHVADAVQYAHQKLVIHRDLKPTNILVTAAGEPKLLDFGLAKPLDDSTVTEHTVSGAFMGSFHYAAPEQLTPKHGTVDTRTDVYALGLILYRLLTGRPPYPISGTMSDILNHIADTDPPRPSLVSHAIDDEVDTITLTALSKEQHRRYQSAGSLRQDIRRYLAGEPILAKGDSHWYVLRKTAHRFRVPLALGATLVVLLVFFGIGMALSANRARIAERRAAASAASLAEALHFSTIERGRGGGRTGNPALAENCIWPEYLSPSELAGIKPRGIHAHWALRELYSQHPCLATLKSGSRLNIVRFIPHTDNIATLLTNGDIVIQGTHPARMEQRIPADVHQAGAMDVTSDGRWLAHAGRDNTIVLCDTTTWRATRTLRGLSAIPTWMQFNTASTHLVASNAEEVMVWDIDTTTAVLTLNVPNGERTATLSPDASALAIASPPNFVDLYDTASGVRTTRFDRAQRSVAQLSFGPDGRLLAAGGWDDAVRVYDVTDGSVVTHIPELSAFPRTMRLFETADGLLRLVAAGGDKILYLWDIPSGEQVFTGAGHTAGIIEFDVDINRSLIATSAGDQTVKLWEMAPLLNMRKFLGHTSTVFSVSFDPQGQRLASSSGHDDLAIKIWSTTSGDILHDLRGHTGVVSKIAFNPDGTILASCSYDGTVRLWDPDSGRHLHTWDKHSSTINSLSFTRTGDVLASASDDKTIRLWNMATLAEDAVLLQDTIRIPSVALHPFDNMLVTSGGYSKSIVLWNLETMTHREIPGHELCSRAVAFSPAGQWLASSGDDHVIHLWSGRANDRGRHIRTLEGHDRDVFAVAFSSDGSILASGDRDGDIKLWETSTGLCLATLAGHRDMVFSVMFSPDDRFLASGSRDTVVGLWDLQYYDRHIEGNRAHQAARVARRQHSIETSAQ